LTDTDRRRRADDRIENVNIKWGGGQPEEREGGGMGWVLHAHTQEWGLHSHAHVVAAHWHHHELARRVSGADVVTRYWPLP
jgi:hypothetical protein